MIDLFDYCGAKWVRVDFHLHSPGSNTFHLPSGLSEEEIAERYVQQLVNQGIQIAAITDYNAICTKWFNLIRAKAQEHNIIIFPGVELCLNYGKYGLHIIAIFPKKTDPEAIERTLHSLDNTPSEPLILEDGKHRKINLKHSAEESISQLRSELGGLIIVAHPNDDNGLFKTLAAEQATKFLKDVRPDAIEGFTDQNINWLISTGKITKSECKRFASVEFSDPKNIGEIGAKKQPNGTPRATYLKLSVLEDLDVDAIRLALHDPEVRVCVGYAPAFNYTHLTSIAIEGSGFCGGIRFSFSPELNTCIGGRGVGKSALLELIRYALDLKPYVPTEYREGLIRHALGSGGKLTLELVQVVSPQVRRKYRIERVWEEPPRVFEVNGQDERHEVELAPCEILGDRELPLFFGQREIYEVSQNEGLRIRLLDEIIGRQAWSKQYDLKKLEEQIRRNARDLLDLQNQLDEKPELEQRLKEIEHQITLYEREGLADKLRQETLLAQDEEYLQQIVSSVKEVWQKWQDVEGITSNELARAAQLAQKAASQNKYLVEKAAQEVNTLLQELKNSCQKVREQILHIQSRLDENLREWKEARRPLDEELQRIKQELGNQTLDPDQLEKLVREQTRLLEKLDRLSKVEQNYQEKQNERKDLLGKLRDTRHEIFQLRERQAAALSEKLRGYVRVKVVYKGQKSEFTEQVRKLLNGSGVDYRSIQKICEKESIDGEQIARIVRAGTEKLKEEFGLTDARANQIITWFQQHPGLLYDLELLKPDDTVHVFLKLDGHELPLEKLSDGQRATAMILLLLTLEERLLIVDQPEDDLDNRFIYDAIVPLLRAQKGKRQIIAATHNPNIPVLGDAELITVLEAQEVKARVEQQGSVDKASIREAVKRIMEGGEEAFRRRAEKYGWYVD